MDYTLRLSDGDLALTLEMLKQRGLYAQVAPLIARIEEQKAEQDFAQQNAELQEAARQAGLMIESLETAA